MTTDPSDMKAAKNPIGKDNDDWLKKLAGLSEIVVCSWGNDGVFLERSKEVIQQIPKLHYLKINKSGEPAHPLYLSATLLPVKWE